ncbi:MAG: hypothetical protein LBC38_01770 [Oscillospiraceae bacterium]|jgi:hypothetical protein|nr:hypothetical protein [Oscillospiraceae bacterium]
MKKKDDGLAKLSELAKRLFVIAPWDEFASDCFLSIVDEKGSEYFLSFSEGIHCLPEADGLRSYLRLLHNMHDENAHYALRSISLTPSENGSYEFRSYFPAHVVWELLDYEVEILMKVYTQAIELLRWVYETKPSVDYSKFESPTRRWDAEREIWVNEIHQLQLGKPEAIFVSPPDEITMRRISAQPRVDAILELDVCMTIKPATDKDYDKPFYPTMIVLCDRPRVTILDLKLLAPDKNIPQETIDVLINFIERYGIPSILYVQSPDVYAMLLRLCEEIGVQIKLIGFLPIVNQFMSEKGLL